jgi:hypothetical protein
VSGGNPRTLTEGYNSVRAIFRAPPAAGLTGLRADDAHGTVPENASWAPYSCRSLFGPVTSTGLLLHNPSIYRYIFMSPHIPPQPRRYGPDGALRTELNTVGLGDGSEEEALGRMLGPPRHRPGQLGLGPVRGGPLGV